MQWSDIDFDNGVIYLYRSKVSNDDFIPMTNRLRTTLLNRQKAVDGEYVFPGRYGGHKTIQNNRALEAAFRRAGLTDVSSHNMRKTFATRLLSRGAAITDVQHLLGHASVKTTEKAYAEFVKNERFKQTIDLLDTPVVPKLKIVKPAGQGDYEKVEWLYDMGHCTNRLSVLLADNNIIWLVRIFAPYDIPKYR